MSEIGKNVANRTFEELLRNNVQFIIPFFQRGYVWQQKEWKQLFDDINAHVVPEIEDLGGDLEKDALNADHFFGPIVAREEGDGTPGMQKFLVIDGQQRITTVYLLLAAIKTKLSEMAHESQKAAEHSNFLSKYVVNDPVNNAGAGEYDALKVLSSKGDRYPTYRLVFGENPQISDQVSADMQRFDQANNGIEDFKKYLGKKLARDFSDASSLWMLAQILLKSLKIVWIPLGEKDDPQAIFESLNDRGVQLTAPELLCNYLFKPLIKPNSMQHEQMHNKYWLDAIAEIDSPSGDFEDYLRTNLSVDEKKTIGKGRRIYVHFKNKHKSLSAEKAKDHLEKIKSGVRIYNKIVNPMKTRNEHPNISDQLMKIKSTGMGACNPFLLSLLQAHADGRANDAAVVALLKETLVVLVRRKVCELPTTKYDSMFPSMLMHVDCELNPGKALREKIRNEGYFVPDQEFEYGLINKALYRPRELPFTRMVLQEIDRSMHDHGQLPDFSTLGTIEHVLPQTLDEHWKKYLGDECQDDELSLYKNTLGNLCLLSQAGNSHAGQDPFKSKKKDYPDVSALTRDVKNRDVHWGIGAIKGRGKDLAKRALKIWAWSE